jgi:hypothetical protein
LNIGFLPLPVDPISKAMTHPLRSTGITPLQHYYEAVRPSPAHCASVNSTSAAGSNAMCRDQTTPP